MGRTGALVVALRPPRVALLARGPHVPNEAAGTTPIPAKRWPIVGIEERPNGLEIHFGRAQASEEEAAS